VSFARDFKGVEDLGVLHRPKTARFLPAVKEFFDLVSPGVDFGEVLIPLCDQGTLLLITAIPVHPSLELFDGTSPDVRLHLVKGLKSDGKHRDMRVPLWASDL